MDTVRLTIDDTEIEVEKGTSVLEAAQSADIYIPALCYHPDIPSYKGVKSTDQVYRAGKPAKNSEPGKEFGGCGLCVVEIEGMEGLPTSCSTPVAEGMVVHTNTPEVQELRRDNLEKLLVDHPHACLVCAQREGCSRTQCSSNVPENERCCVKFGNCELQKVSEYVGIKESISRYTFKDLPIEKEEPLYERNYNLCIGCLRCVRVCNDVRGVGALGFVFQDGKVIVGHTAPTAEESGCRFCGACVEVCPTGALLDKGITLAQRDEENLVPCKHTCPAEVDIPRYVHLVAEGRFADAVAVIREKVPFPETLGNICPHDCELKCRRGEINEPVSIRALKRVAAEHDDKRWKEKIKIAPSTGKKVAIIGSGPAGLTVAYYLTELGHSVTIFESQSKPGGMMRTGIPRFQLSEKVLDGEIDEILSLGVELKLSSPVQSVNDLLKDGYDAVFVGIGLQKGRKLPIPGVDLEQVLIGLDFLEDVSKGKEVKLGENVLVLGGGAVACDVARVARRLGAPQVSMSCLESRETLPARPWEIKEAEEEGIKIFPSRSFKRILENDGRVSGVECVDVKWMEFDADGKLNLETVEGSEHILEADTVIFAIGQALDRTLIENDGLELTKRGAIKASPENLETTHEGVFAGGDAASGPASVIEAIATGRKAASSIDEYLGGDGEIEESLIEKEELSPYLGKEEGFAGKERIEAPLVSIEERVKSLDKKVELCLTEEQAIEEAKRCLRCDLRFQLGEVVLPPEAWIEFTEENIEELVPETEGVYRLVDEEKNIVYIGGAINLREDMDDQMLDADEPPLDEVRYFDFEEEPMYTVRQSELLQQYLQQHGSMPPGN